MRKPLPPPTPPPATLSIEKLRVSLPLFAIALLVGGAVLLIRYPEQSRRTVERTAAAEESMIWAVDLRPALLSSVGSAVTGALPSPLEGQRRPPCDQEVERELRGACWVPVAVDRCPKGKAFVNDEGPASDGRCYIRSMQAARAPTSGDVQRASVADP